MYVCEKLNTIKRREKNAMKYSAPIKKRVGGGGEREKKRERERAEKYK